jgi:AraC family transcriptional regulator, transcriptional activator FtrA
VAEMAISIRIMPKRPNPLVAILAYDDLCTFEFSCAFEVFGLSRPEMGPQWYRCVTASAEPGPIRCVGGLKLEPMGGLELLEEADTIVIPGWRGPDATAPAPLLEALRRANETGIRIISICGGTFVLAQAGLLAGKRATTHWRHLARLAARYPEIVVERRALYVDEGSILTSAGSAAGLDLCIHVVRKDFGARAANSVARRLVIAAHRDGGQSQFIELSLPAHVCPPCWTRSGDVLTSNGPSSAWLPRPESACAAFNGKSTRRREWPRVSGFSANVLRALATFSRKRRCPSRPSRRIWGSAPPPISASISERPSDWRL